MKNLKSYFKILYLILGAFIVTGCDGGGCTQLEPLPANLPANQTLENGMQLRVTDQGFQTIKVIMQDVVVGEFGQIATLPSFYVGSGDATNPGWGIHLCAQGCPITTTDLVLDLSLEDSGDVSNNIDECRRILGGSNCDEIWADISTDIHFAFELDVIAGGMSLTHDCSLNVGFTNDNFEATMALGLHTRPQDGEMRIMIDYLTDLDLSGLGIELENCLPSFVEDLLNALILSNIGQYVEMVQQFVGNAVVDWVANYVIIPLLEPTIDKLFPDPMGVEGVLNLGTFMTDAGFLGVKSDMELKIIPGGYVDAVNGGLTIGMITGFNSDADTNTRGESVNEYDVMAHSENAKCIPPIKSFDLRLYSETVTHVPHACDESVCSTQDREKSYTRPILTKFNGSGDQAFKFADGNQADVAIALTVEMLNQIGFHMVNSGALCLTVGTEQSELLNVGTFAVLIPSLSELIDPRVGDARLQMVIRPQNAIRFTVGDGGDSGSALIDMAFDDFQIDIYPFVNGRYARALTLALDMHMQMDLVEGFDETLNTITVMPTLRSLDESQISARVLNSELIRENPEDIEAIFPAILGMIMPMMTSALQPIPMPKYEITKINSNGQEIPYKTVRLENLEFESSLTNDAVVIVANLVSANPFKKVDLSIKHKFSAKITEATTYSPERLRNTLKGLDNANPVVKFEITPEDSNGPYEYQYRIDGSAWYAFQTSTTFEIKDSGLFLNGKHSFVIRGRKKGYPRTISDEIKLIAVLDSVPPTIKPSVKDNEIKFDGYDYISKTNLLYSVKLNGKWSEWSSKDTISIQDAQSGADADGKLYIKVKDEYGNSSEDSYVVKNLTITSDNKGFGCSSSGTGSSGLFSIFLLLGTMLILRKKKSLKFFRAFSVLIMATAVFSLGCADNKSGNNTSMPSCYDDDECSGISCPQDEIPLCIGGTCDCVDDIPWGIPGPHSSLTVIGQYAWVASYNMTYGDLMVAKVIPSDSAPAVIRPNDWYFIDGVPEGPVVLPTSDVRWGINSRGDDVGGYTSIGEMTIFQPIIAHHNYDTGALRITYTTDGTDWISYDLDDGGLPWGSNEMPHAGLFNDLVIHANGNPGIAYMTNNIINAGQTALVSEVNYAIANTNVPESTTDWTIYNIDSVEYPIPTGDEPVGDWPEGSGQFISQDRYSDGRVVLAWFDKTQGVLKFSYQETVDGTFTIPVIITGDATDELPRGLFSSIAIDSSDMVQFVYQDVMQRSLWHATLELSTGVVEETFIDDGFRMDDGLNDAGLPMPVQHYFGADSSIVITGPKVFLVWQDSTTQELYLGILNRDDAVPEWDIQILRGRDGPVENPYEGSFGFYIDTYSKGEVFYISNYGVDLHAVEDILGQPALRYFVEVYSVHTGIVE
jgi:hypothetical protein